jgi:hypothetical protein
VRWTTSLLTAALIGLGLPACSSSPDHQERSGPAPATSAPLTLSCADSAGQQGADHETVVGGFEGLVLPDSANPAGLYPVRDADGKRYFI